MRDVIARIVDGSRFREFKKEYGTTIVTVSTARRLSLSLSSPHALTRRAGLRAHPRLPGRDRGEQRDPVLAVGAQGGALHRALLAARRAAPLPRQRHRLHGRLQGGARRHRQGWRKDGPRRRVRGRAEADRRRRRELRRWELRCAVACTSVLVRVKLRYGMQACVGARIRRGSSGCGQYVAFVFSLVHSLDGASQNAKVSVMGPGQLSQVMATVSK